MKIALAADHGGFEMKNQIAQYLISKNFDVVDLGTNSSDSVDYPDFAQKVVQKLSTKEADLGILVCGTGIGISIAANRHKGIRAALLYDDYVAQVAKEHNNANVLCFGGRTMKIEDVEALIEEFADVTYDKADYSGQLAHALKRVQRMRAAV